MKFKVAVIGLLAAILAVCLFTSYTLIDKTNRQFELQKLNVEIALEQFGLDQNVIYYASNPESDFATRKLQRWREKVDEIIGQKQK